MKKLIICLFLLASFSPLLAQAPLESPSISDTIYYTNLTWNPQFFSDSHPIRFKEVRRLLKTNEASKELMRKRSVLNIVGSIIAVPSGYLLGYNLPANDQPNRGRNLLIGAAGTLVSLAIDRKAKIQLEQAIAIFNEDVKNKSLDATSGL